MLVLALLVGVATAPAGVLNADASGGNTYEGKVDYVKDGDSFRTQRPLMQGGIDEVRTLYIDAPETFSACGFFTGAFLCLESFNKFRFSTFFHSLYELYILVDQVVPEKG